MDHFDLPTLAVEPHRPEVIDSSRGQSRSIVLQLPAGDLLQEHQVHERAHLVVIAGTVDVRSDAETVPAGPGSYFVFEPAEPHEVTATQDARLLLVLAPWPGEGHPGATD